MKEKQCPFCSQAIKEAVFASDCGFIAVYNIAPVLPGHCMIIPEIHVQSLMHLTDEEVCNMMRFSRKVIVMLQQVFKTPYFD